MRLFLIGALLITFPAIVAAIYAAMKYGTAGYMKYWLLAALLVLGMNSLPFLAAALLLRKSNDSDLSH
jgi:hypothetical protein